jgi:hypothetical protein
MAGDRKCFLLTARDTTMRNKNSVKENQARRRLLRFSLFTLGGMGLEGSYLPTKDQSSEKKAGVIAA